jgi:hypothetical protein
MLGIILTLFAVFLVICFAFCYSDRPSGRGVRADALFFVSQKAPKKDARKQI